MSTTEEKLQALLVEVDKTSNWLVGYCCSYRGPDHGHRLRKLLDDYLETLDGHGTSDSR